MSQISANLRKVKLQTAKKKWNPVGFIFVRISKHLPPSKNVHRTTMMLLYLLMAQMKEDPQLGILYLQDLSIMCYSYHLHLSKVIRTSCRTNMNKKTSRFTWTNTWLRTNILNKLNVNQTQVSCQRCRHRTIFMEATYFMPTISSLYMAW